MRADAFFFVFFIYLLYILHPDHPLDEDKTYESTDCAARTVFPWYLLQMRGEQQVQWGMRRTN